MARDRKADIIIGAKDQASKKIKGIGASIVVMNQAMELGAKFARAFGEAYDFGKLGAEVEKTEFAFNRMSEAVGANADQTLSEIRRLTGGTISDFELMQKAAKATTLGIPIDKVGEFAEIARAAAAAMGESTEFMFDSIVTGTARQSKLILDNLGIIIDMGKVYQQETKRLGHALSETEKKQAFMNAVIESGQDIIRDIGDTSKLASEKFAAFEASISNLRDAIAKIIAGPLGDMLVTLADIATRITNMITGVNDLQAAVQSGDIELEEWNETFEKSKRLMDAFLDGVLETAEKVNAFRESLDEEDEAQIRVNESLEDFHNSLGRVAVDMTLARDGLNEVHEGQLDVKDSMVELNDATVDNIVLSEKQIETLGIWETRSTKALTTVVLANIKATKKIEKAWTNLTIQSQRNIMDFVATASYYMDAFQSRLVEAMFDTKTQFKDLWQDMAKDFINLFIDKILMDIKLLLLEKLLKLLIMFGPHHENDMKVVQMGRAYARYFQQGVFEGMDASGLAGGMARGMLPAGSAVQIGAAVPAPTVTVVIQGNVIGQDEYVYDQLIPAIEEAVTRKESNLVVD